MVMTRKAIILCVLCVLCVLNSVQAQPQATTSTQIEALLQSEAITYAQAARFILDAANQLTTSSQQEAYEFAQERNWLPRNTEQDTTARLDGVSLILVNAFDIKGGLFYSISKSPHYAYRELVYRDAIQGRTAPGMKVSGELLLYIINRLLGEQDRLAAIAEAKEREARERRQKLAEEITATITQQEIANTTVEATSQGVMITISNIQFLADSAELPEYEAKKLQEIAVVLRNIPNVKLLVTGHTAMAGSEEGRQRISQERAQAVADYLVSLRACSRSNITARGFGSDQPIASNATEAGMALNRRVEITILE